MIAFDTNILTDCAANNAKLISRNRRDFERIPGLAVEFWE
jgi:predicted nucleic acid-binding protein